jgi:hypothetical protein
VSPYAATAEALIAAGLISWSIRQDIGKPLAANKQFLRAVKEAEMSDDLASIESAAAHLLTAANYLADVVGSYDYDDPHAAYLKFKINMYRDDATSLLPQNGSWPEPKDGMGVILPFIPRQTG